MPAFDKVLSDDDIIAVLAFIKSRWPTGIRASQSMLNPGFKGMPKDADKIDWTLPPQPHRLDPALGPDAAEVIATQLRILT